MTLRIEKCFGQRPLAWTAVLAGVLVVGSLTWRAIHPPRDPRLEKLKAYPLTLRQLDAYYREPAGHNAALDYSKVFSSELFQKVSDLRDFLRQDLLPARGEGLSAEASARLLSLLNEHQETFRQLHQISGEARYPIDLKNGRQTLLPHLANLRYGVLLLCGEALLAAAAADSEGSTEALSAALRLSDSLSEEPCQVSYSCRISSLGAVLQRLERVLNLIHPSDSQLQRLAEALEVAETSLDRAPERALAGELAMGVSFFDDATERRNFFLQGRATVTPAEQASLVAGMAALKLSGAFGRDRTFYLDSMTERLAATRLPFPERFLMGRRAATNFASSTYMIFSQSAFPRLAILAKLDAEHIVCVRCARTSLAIERFRLRNSGQPPISLERLVPEFLPSVPLDTFTGKPLFYKQTEGGYLIYSVGPDLKDDCGLEREPQAGDGPHDYVFKVIPAK